MSLPEKARTWLGYFKPEDNRGWDEYSLRSNATKELKQLLDRAGASGNVHRRFVHDALQAIVDEGISYEQAKGGAVGPLIGVSDKLFGAYIRVRMRTHPELFDEFQEDDEALRETARSMMNSERASIMETIGRFYEEKIADTKTNEVAS